MSLQVAVSTVSGFMFRHIIHLHIPAFPIAVGRICQPEIRNRPVAVAPLQSARATVLSVSLEARKEGIFKGMPVGRAMKLCPNLTLLPPDPELAERACRSLAEVVAQYTPLWEPSRPGDIYLDLTGTERLWGKAKDAGYRLRQEVQSRLRLCAAVGVAGNKMVSGIASRISPSESVLDVVRGQEASFMAPLKVGVVPGIDRFRRKILLEELNIIHVRQLAVLGMNSLRLVFGRQAFVIHQRAVGIDLTPVYTVPAKPMVSEEITLVQDENDDRKLLGALYGMVEKCSQRLRGRSLFPQKGGLLIRYSDGIESKRQVKMPHPSFWDFDLYDPLEKLFFKACKRRVRVRFMKIRFWDFSSCRQLSLFHKVRPDEEKKTRIIKTLDQIRERYDEGAIKYGRTVE
jgi:DNA polymerase-4